MLVAVLLFIVSPILASSGCPKLDEYASLLFLVDSSASIGDRDWNKLVSFLKSGSGKIPNSARVGFVKFSTEVSDQKWVEPKWTAEDFQKAVPSEYDVGETNTPAALKEAKKMLEGDASKTKIVILVTDGLPYTSELNTFETAFKATKDGFDSLHADGVRTILISFGSLLDEGNQLQKLLSNPDKDHTSVNVAVESDFDKILEVVCN